MTLRVVAASFGLITCLGDPRAPLDGYIEAHFHFFVMVGVLTLYQAWVPFLVAIGYVVVHHGIVGILAPESVYSHRRRRSPTRGSGRSSTAAFVLAASVAHIVAWRTNEDQLLRDPLTSPAEPAAVPEPPEPSRSSGSSAAAAATSPSSSSTSTASRSSTTASATPPATS